VHDAQVAFHDAMAKLISGVNSGNQTSIVNDLNATKVGLQNAVTAQELTGRTLQNAEKVMYLLDKEAALVGSIDTANPTHVSAVNGQITKVQSHILNIVNHDATLAAQAVGADGTTGVAASPSRIDPVVDHGHSDFLAAIHHFGHVWG
jgi:hypothetical protein